MVLEIEVQGARQVRDTMPEAIRIFIEPPSAAVLRERLIGRGTDAPDVIEMRLREAETELKAKDEFAHRVTNDDVDRAASELAVKASEQATSAARTVSEAVMSNPPVKV